MPRKPFPWRALTPHQIDLMERLVEEGGSVSYGDLGYAELLAFEDLRQIGLVDMTAEGRERLKAVITEAGLAVRENGYLSERIVLRITEPQIRIMSFVEAGAEAGRPLDDFQGSDLEVCRRLSIRGWIVWEERHGNERRARLTPSGREALLAVQEWDDAVAQSSSVKRAGLLN